MTDLTLTATRTIQAPVKTVYDAWLDPKMLARIMAPGANMSVPRAETDPRVGGRFLVVMKNDDREMPHAGTYLDLTPHSRIVFTWESPFSVDGSTVTIDLRPAGKGTEVILTHIKFASPESRDNHKGGWTAILGMLAAAFEPEGRK